MKKYLALVLVLVSIFALAGCGGGSDSTGVFKFTEAEVADGKKLPGTYELEELTMKYPDNWSKPEQSMGPMFILMRDDSANDFKANMNVLKAPSSKEFSKLSTDDFKKEYADKLKSQGINGMEVVNIEKGKWQGNDAIYVEYKATFMDFNVHYAQYLVDNGKNMFIITFVSSEDEWNDVQADARKIAASVQLAQPKK